MMTDYLNREQPVIPLVSFALAYFLQLASRFISRW
jgi:hypothetical protein